MATDEFRAKNRSRDTSDTDRPNDEIGERTVRCPACTGPAVYSAANPYRPFCGARCKNGDLADWATEQMRIAEQTSDLLEEHEREQDKPL